MEIVSNVSFLVAFLVIVECLVRKSDFFSPVRIYLFFHSLALGVAFLALHEAMTPFKPFTSLVYFGSSASLMLGAGCIGLLWPARKWALRRIDFERYNWRVHFAFAFAMLALFVVGMTMARLQSGVFPLLAENKGKALKTFFMVSFPIGIAFSTGGMVGAFFFMALFRRARLPVILRISFWMLVLTMGVYALALSRSGVIYFAFFAVTFYNLGVRRLPLWKLGVIAFLFLSFVLVTGVFKSMEIAKKHKVETEKVIELGLKVPYVYAANNFWNLDYALNTENYEERHPPTYGFVTVSGILDYVYLPGGYLARDVRANGGFDDQYNKSIVKSKGLNTVSYQWGLYRDFGLIGVFLGSFLIGMILSLLYRRAAAYPTMLNVAAYAHLLYFIALSMFGYFPEASLYVYGLFYVCLCCYLGIRLAPPAGLEPARPSGER